MQLDDFMCSCPYKLHMDTNSISKSNLITMVLAEPSFPQTVADMVQQCREVLFPNKFLRVEGWALVEAAGYSFLESSQKEEDCVMMQCREQSQLCIARSVKGEF